jgi:ferric-dicitrate binding protein FerR (iron transport regulator)
MAAVPLIVTYLKGEASPEEALYVEQWASSSPEHRDLFDRVWREWHMATGERVEGIPDAHEEWEVCRKQFFNGAEKISLTAWLKSHLWQVATAILLLAIAGWVLYARVHHASVIPGPVRPPLRSQQAPVKDSTGKEDSTHLYDFRNISLEEAVRVISKDYGIRIVAVNPQILKCRFTTLFDHESLTYILDVVTETLNIHYDYSPDRHTVYLSGKGCE